jgi:L-iditol 2-dehydrogenase
VRTPPRDAPPPFWIMLEVKVLVARLYGAGDIRIGAEDRPAPKGGGEAGRAGGADGAGGAGEREALVRVTAVGICGSDLHWWTEGAIGDAKLAHPLVLGHEGAGVIESGPRAGQRVAIDPAITCGTCRACRAGYRNLCYLIRFSGHGDTDGMLREVMAWPSSLLHPLPDSVSDAGGAMLEPLGVALWSLDLGHLPFDGTASVVGCGPIGLLLIQLLKAAGASRVIAVEPLAHRREAAARCGADLVLEPDEPMSGFGVDVAFEVAGNDDSVRIALESVRPGGRVVLTGIPDGDTTTFTASLARRKGLTIALTRRMNDVYPRAISLAARGVVDLESLVSRRAALSEAADAFTAAVDRSGLKVIIEPQRGLSSGQRPPLLPLPPR